MTIEAMLGCLEQMVETCLEMKAKLEQERERREKKRDERKEAKERRDKEEPKKAKELTTTTTNAGARTCVYAYEEHPTIADVETHCVLKHVDKSYAKKWLDFIASEGWHFASGAIVTRSNFRPSFNAWYKRERQHEREFSSTSTISSTPSTTAKSWKEREFEAREAEIKQRREEADRKAREEGLRILDEIKRNGGL